MLTGIQGPQGLRFGVQGGCVQAQMQQGSKLLKGGYIGDYIGDDFRAC